MVARLQGDRGEVSAAWQQRLSDAARDAVMADHYATSSRSVTRQDLAALEPEDIRTLHQQAAVAGNVVVSLYGAFDSRELIPRLSDYLTNLEGLAERRACGVKRSLGRRTTTSADQHYMARASDWDQYGVAWSGG